MRNEEKQEAIDLLKMFVDTNTVNPPGNEEVLADKICNYLKDTQVHIQKITVDKNRANIVACIKGKGEIAPIILCGHMDTVPYGNQNMWIYPPERLTMLDNYFYGRGTSDMKSGLAAITYSFKKVAQLDKMPKGDIYLVATADEETNGIGAEKVSSLLPLKESTVLIAEPSNNEIGICSKGTLWLSFEIWGKSAHGAYPDKGINAVDIAYKLYNQLRVICKQYVDDLLNYSTCTITGISGGTKLNMVPDYCNIKMDVRTIPLLKNNIFLQKTDIICNNLMKLYDGLKIKFTILNNREPVSINKNNEMVQSLFNILNETLGCQPKYRGIKFFSDASIFVRKEANVKCILFGPGKDDNAHITDEYVEKNAYFTSIVCYNKLLLRYF